jgi:hypothetical protein
MSTVRNNAKSIENRNNSLKIWTKLFETFCPFHEAAILKKINKVLLGSSLIFYFVAIDRDPRSTSDRRKMWAETYTRQDTVPQRVKIDFGVTISMRVRRDGRFHQFVPGPVVASRRRKFFFRRQSVSSLIVGRINDPRPGLRALSMDLFVTHWCTIYPSLHVVLLRPRVERWTFCFAMP